MANTDRLETVGVVVVSFGRMSASVDLATSAVRALGSPDVAAHGIVVDNLGEAGEWDDNAIIRIERLPNPGYGAAMNHGVRIALAEGATSLVLMTHDVEISASDLQVLHGHLRSGTADVIGPALSIDGVVSRGLDASRRRVRHVDDLVTPTVSVTAVDGAVLVMASRVWAALEGFREDYFLYWRTSTMAGEPPVRGSR